MMKKKLLFKKKTEDRHRIFRLVLLTGIILIYACISTSSIYAADSESESIQEGITVTGTVTDEDGQTLPGVTILEKGTTNGTITNVDGQYSITVETGATLVISYVGMQTQEFLVTSQTVIDVVLNQSLVGLDEVLVIGYGTQSRRTITTAITKVSAEKLEDVPVTSVTTALQGKLSGVRIWQSEGGQPGSEASMIIRGGSSINKSNDPLVIIDGMVRSLDDINPNDVESVQVLKDASSTAIYGARASNGVVLVTTKRGKLGKAQINFDANVGTAAPWKYLDMVDARDYLSMVRPAVARGRYASQLDDNNRPFGHGNDGYSPHSPYRLGPGESVPDGWESMPDPLDPSETLVFQDNDWQDISLNPALEQYYNLSANGGTEMIKYAASIGYTDNEGISLGTYFNRINIRANVDFDLRDNITLSTRLDHSSSKSNDYWRAYDVFNRCIWLAPTSKIYLEDGSYAAGNNATYAPVTWYNDTYKQTGYKYRTGIGSSLNWEILPGLQAEFSGDYYLRSRTFESFTNANVYNSNRETKFEYVQKRVFQAEGVITYDKTLADMHHINVVGGVSQIHVMDFNSNSVAEGASTDLIWTLNAAPLKLEASTSRSEDLLMGAFGRATYDFRQKYLLGVSLRRDVSSRFADGYRVGYFPGASVGWIVSEENFMQSIPVINTLKLRGSIGQTGNNDVARYAYGGIYAVGNNYFGMAGTLPSEMPNPTLRWETTTQWDVGFDLGLFAYDRVTLLFDYFDKITSDLIFNVPLPNESGYNNIDQNIGKVKIYGTEVELRARIIDRGKFRWSADANIGYFMNRVLELPDNGIDKNRIGGIYDPVAGTGVGGIAEGERMFGILGYVSDFIIDNQAEADNAYYDALASGFSPVDGNRIKGRKIPGDMEWVDQNGDGVIDAYDQVVLGYTTPTTTGGISNTLSYGNFGLSFFLDYALGHSIYDATIRRAYGNVNGGMYNVLRESMTDTWTEDGDYASGKATMPRFDMQDQKHQKNYQRTHDRSVYKGDYLCIREFRFTYNAPESFASLLRLQSLRFSVSGQNLWYFQSYPGWVTESGKSNSSYKDDAQYPIPRKIMFGIHISL